MADVKWIKMMVGMFDGMSFKKIKRAKIGGESYRDKLTAIWFELMDFAGKCNHDGAFVGTNEIPFTDLSDIAIMIDRDEDELKLCMAFYIKEGMVTIIDEVYSLTNWAAFQNKDGLDKIREQNRLRKQKQREKQKLLSNGSQGSHVTVTQCHALEEEREKEKEEDTEKERMNERKTTHSFAHADNSFSNVENSVENCNDADQVKAVGGLLGQNVVMLSENQMADLMDQLSLDEFNKYVKIVAEAETAGRHYKKKTHYQAILDMAMHDRKVAGARG